MQKILCIDDDVVQLELISDMLRGRYEVISAQSGKEGLDYLDQGMLPLAIILDIVMPQMDGWETYNKIRAISLVQDVAVLFITGHTGISAYKHALVIGADDYIEKPITKPDLLRRIEQAVSNRIKTSAESYKGKAEHNDYNDTEQFDTE